MNRIPPRHTLQDQTITMMAFALAIAGMIFSLSGERSHAQQQRDRQLVQPPSTKTNNGKRIALVIGNGAYTSAPPLKNPPNDARDMAAALKSLGFDVTSGINVNQKEMKRLVREFGQKLKAGGSGLFYYAGHGVQSKGRNYLIPVDAEIQSEAEVEDSGVDIGFVLTFMDDAQNGLNIVILDACRNNPFARSFRSASEGLAQVDAPTGTLIAYATAPGRVASDGPGQNGLYTSELLKAMRVPGLSATEMFMRVRAEVMKQTANKQVPWEASSLVGAFYFSGPAANAANTGAISAPGNESRVDPAAFELTYWDSIKNSTDPEDFKSYLEQYPNGKFVSLARNRLKALEDKKRQTSATSNAAQTENCFGSDAGAASTNWKSHFDWAQNQTLARLKQGLDWKLASLFQCPSRPDEQIFDTFADVSLIVARYVPNAACFKGDSGVVGTDRARHRNWAKARGRTAALPALQWKVLAAMDCLDRSRQLSYYADVSAIVAGGGQRP